jgi:tRNA(Leu) C34 or U34 (ribose-2'-O)-methylase TrmL
VLAAIGGAVAIPMDGRAESLNVGVACAVLCFEALRQRRSLYAFGTEQRDVTGRDGDVNKT